MQYIHHGSHVCQSGLQSWGLQNAGLAAHNGEIAKVAENLGVYHFIGDRIGKISICGRARVMVLHRTK
jgi:hypothetical protein